LTFHEFLADFLTFGPWPIQAINVVSASGRLVCDTERCVAASLGNTPHFQAGWVKNAWIFLRIFLW